MQADLVEANFIRPRDKKIAEELKSLGGVPIEVPAAPVIPASPFGGLDSMFGSSGPGADGAGAGGDMLGGLLGALGSSGATADGGASPLGKYSSSTSL